MSEAPPEGGPVKGPLVRDSGPQDPRLKGLPAPLQDKAQRGDPFSLFLAPGRIALLILPAVAIGAGIVYRQGLRSGGTLVGIAAAVAVVLIGATLDRRIDVDTDALT